MYLTCLSPVVSDPLEIVYNAGSSFNLLTSVHALPRSLGGGCYLHRRGRSPFVIVAHTCVSIGLGAKRYAPKLVRRAQRKISLTHNELL